jgi:hypothetical protein
MNKDDKMCPSTTCHEGAILLGVVQSNETVALLDTGYIVDSQFVAKAQETGRPEQRFRFAGKCIQHGCKQWTGKQCGVIKEYADVNDHVTGNEVALPDCIIRERCRWYSQEGGKACMICPYVITDNLV